ncbi:MAG: radical SAM protein [Anaerolineae bacterium]|jgi:putative DNA modification/repair radical SAM protein
MEIGDKLETLGESAQYDLCNACGSATRTRDDLGRWIYPAALPDGRQVRVLKVLLTNVCDRNCYYCSVRASRDVPRTSFTPEELARAFDRMHRADLVDGVFLSSAVCAGSGPTMDRMLACIELIRGKYEFNGYVHLKLLPGVSEAHIERALQLAHRVSVNLEAPSAERLAVIAPRKDFFEELARPMRVAKRLINASGGRLAPAGQSTQFVVGAAGEADREILSTTARLYRELDLRRTYYSAFQPVPGTPLDSVSPTPAWREHRLYQADWLLRFYGFTFDDLIFDGAGNLPRTADPKMLYAHSHPELFPVEVNRAPREELLRVPGIGPRSADRILRWRRQGTLRELSHLGKAGAVTTRAASFVALDGQRPPHQLPLWKAWPA